MSRSYRKPYASCSSKRSAHYDKTLASRGFRRAQNNAIRSFKPTDTDDWDEFIIPVRLEASHNQVYTWGRDGRQWLQDEPKWTGDIFKWTKYSQKSEEELLERSLDFFERDKAYYADLKRK